MSLTTLIAFIIGIFIGGNIGCFITCLVVAGRDDSEEEKNMKKVVFIGKEKGCLTPEAQAKFLAKHAHLECISEGSKYYTYAGSGFKVIMVGKRVAQIIKMPEDEVKRIASCSKLDFGGF